MMEKILLKKRSLKIAALTVALSVGLGVFPPALAEPSNPDLGSGGIAAPLNVGKTAMPNFPNPTARVGENLTFFISGESAEAYLAGLEGLTYNGAALSKGSDYSVENTLVTIFASKVTASGSIDVVFTNSNAVEAAYTARALIYTKEAPSSSTQNTPGASWLTTAPTVAINYTAGSGGTIDGFGKRFLVSENATEDAGDILNAYTAPVQLTDGTWYVHASAADYFYSIQDPGEAIVSSFGPYKVDTAAPSVEAGSLSASNVGHNAMTVTARAADETSGIAGYAFAYGDSAPTGETTYSQNTSADFSDLSSGTSYKIWMRAKDNAGNESDWTMVGAHDTLSSGALTVTADVGSSPNWTTGNVTVSLTFASPNGVENLPSKQYQLSHTNTPGDTWTDYTEPVTISEDGEWYLHYKADDGVHTGGTTGMFGAYKIDKTKPEIKAGSLESTNAALNGFTVSATATDTASGIVGYAYKTGETAPEGATTYYEYSKYSFTSLESGTGYKIWMRAKDAAGNESDWTMVGQAMTVSYNKGARPKDISLPTSSYSSGLIARNSQISLSSIYSDAKIYYTINGNEPNRGSMLYTGPITVDKDMKIQTFVLSGGRESKIVTFNYTVGKEGISQKTGAKTTRYIKARSENEFEPDVAMTRYDTIDGLALLYDVKKTGTGKTFTDVDSAHKDVAALFSSAGIITGFEDDSFRGEEGLTRAEFVKIMAVILGLEVKDSASEFPDMGGHWADKYVGDFMKLGYVAGYPDGNFYPDRKMTRAEFIAIVNRITGATGTSVASVFDDVSTDHWAFKDIMAAYII